MRIIFKCPLSIKSLSFSVIRIVFFTTFMGMKDVHLAFIRAKLRISRFLSRKCFPTKLTGLTNFAWASLTPLFKTPPRTKSSPFIFTTRNIRRTLSKSFATAFTNYFNKRRARFIITNSRAIFSSILIKRFLTDGTSFHRSNIPLAMANVNNNQPAEVTRLTTIKCVEGQEKRKTAIQRCLREK